MFERGNAPCGVYSVVKNVAIRLSVVSRVGTQDVPALRLLGCDQPILDSEGEIAEMLTRFKKSLDETARQLGV